MSDLTNQKRKNTFASMLWIPPGNTGLTSTPKRICDGDGTQLPVQVSTGGFDFDAGALKVGGQDVLIGKNNYAATSDPTSNNDSTEGYQVGSFWINISTNPRKVFILRNNAPGAAVWAEIAYRQDNLAATSNPGSSNDASQGYSIGSLWVRTNASPRRAWICVNSTNASAVWREIDFNPMTNNYSASAAPSSSNDSTEGYSAGSIWINQSTDKVYMCSNATAGAADWELLNTTTTFRRISELAANNINTSNPSAIGEFRTFTKNASALTYADNATVQSLASIQANGFQIYSVNGSSAGANGQPNRVQVYVGQNKNVQFEFYRSTGRSGLISTDFVFDSSGNEYGLMKHYDQALGIVTVGLVLFGSSGNRFVGVDYASAVSGPTYPSNCYFDVLVNDI